MDIQNEYETSKKDRLRGDFIESPKKPKHRKKKSGRLNSAEQLNFNQQSIEKDA